MHIYPERASLLELGTEILKLVSYGATWEQWEEWLSVPLEHAAARGNICLVNKLLDAGADGGRGWNGCRDRTLLDAAALGGNADVVSALIKAGAQPDVNKLSFALNRRSALYTATVCGHEDAGSRLILAGADVLFWDPVDQRNVISEAARGGHRQLVNDMLIAGANANEYCYESPLQLAASAGHDGIVSTLLLRGADPDVQTDEGETPLMKASQHGRLPIVKILLTADADAHVCAHDGRSALHAAAEGGGGEIAAELLDYDVDMDITDNDGESPLISAARAGNYPMAQVLLTAGADTDTRDKEGYSALDRAAAKGHAHILTDILRNGADANGCNSEGLTALHRACTSGADTEDAIQALIDGGADVEFKNEAGATPLSDATREFNCKSILALLRNGADPNSTNAGNTPLHEACLRRFHGLEKVVDALLRWGADDKAWNTEHQSPWLIL